MRPSPWEGRSFRVWLQSFLGTSRLERALREIAYEGVRAKRDGRAFSWSTARVWL